MITETIAAYFVDSHDYLNSDLIKYYQDRAEEYEKVYFKPERQSDLREAAVILKQLFAGKSVLEIACGTGYWTEHLSHSAASILGTDINDAVIEIARHKKYAQASVSFEVADLYKMQRAQSFNSLFGGFIISHIPLQDLDKFKETPKRLLSPGDLLVLMDNKFVEKNNHPISYTDEQGNTYQDRKLSDGSEHRVLKNFTGEDFLRKEFSALAEDIRFYPLQYFWIMSCRLQA